LPRECKRMLTVIPMKLGNFDRDEAAWAACDGPWDDEPDWMSTVAPEGYSILLLRNMSTGYWRGYVMVAPDHIAYGRDDVKIRFHGGYTAFREMELPEGLGIESATVPPELWVFGFECNHGSDFMPFDAVVRDDVPDWKH